MFIDVKHLLDLNLHHSSTYSEVFLDSFDKHFLLTDIGIGIDKYIYSIEERELKKEK